MTQLVALDTPVGRLLLEATPDALVHLALPDTATASAPVPSAHDVELVAPLATTVTQLEEYFAGARTEFDVPMALGGTPFQRDVWTTLADIPYGKTVSYAELAAMVGRPTAFRAVGQANGANPLPIVLPCHRVLASGGRIGGYGGGLPLKRALLALEGVQVA
jgi:methylated-DNA-[protein]-cysteine S-methyltransferase